jgi:POT family proton-dependent oligopeptide transporter
MFFGLLMFRLTANKHLGDIGIKPKAKETKSPEKSGGSSGRIALLMVVILVAFIWLLNYTGVVNLTNIRGIAEAMGYIIVAIAALFFIYVLSAGGLTPFEKKRVGLIIILFIGAALFWSGFEQAGSSLNLFSDRHTLRFFGPLGISGMIPIIIGITVFLILSWFWYTRIFKKKDLLNIIKIILALIFISVGCITYWILGSINEGWEMPASWLQSVNPMFIILLSPFFGWLWVKLAMKNMNPSAPLKFGFGLVCLGMGFLVMVFAARVIAGGLPEDVKVTAMWLVMTYLLHTVGELTLSPVGLSMTTKLAPKKFAGQMMGIWFIGAALGNLIAGLFAGNFNEDAIDQMPNLFLSVVVFTVGAGLLFFAFSLGMKLKDAAIEENLETE